MTDDQPMTLGEILASLSAYLTVEDIEFITLHLQNHYRLDTVISPEVKRAYMSLDKSHLDMEKYIHTEEWAAMAKLRASIEELQARYPARAGLMIVRFVLERLVDMMIVGELTSISPEVMQLFLRCFTTAESIIEKYCIHCPLTTPPLRTTRSGFNSSSQAKD